MLFLRLIMYTVVIIWLLATGWIFYCLRLEPKDNVRKLARIYLVVGLFVGVIAFLGLMYS